ncbi:MAG TPA: glycosyltransferase family 2 protein [Acidimicrobiales bacterium]|nr:glycosyltransferase family 2 protein [Acidimicrobiales bacterium]
MKMSSAKPARRRRDATALSSNRALLSACMIVKDEEKSLPRCLASLQRVVDEVVIYDTGSTDSTVALARRSGARVIEGYWDDDFGRARNESLGHCRGEWVLWIDADEALQCESAAGLRQALEDWRDLDGMLVTIYNLAGDGSEPGGLHEAVRIFRRSTACWYGRLHEQVDARPTLGRQLKVGRASGAQVNHYGYLDAVVKERDKLARNLHLAEAELASGVVVPSQEGVAQMNVGRALAALRRYSEAQPYLDHAIALCPPGPQGRSALLFAVQNLIALGRIEEAVERARQFRDRCQVKGLADYFEGVALRRLGRPEEAAAMLASVEKASNEDGFSFPDNLVQAELAGSLLAAGRAAEATDQLVRLVSASTSPGYVAASLEAFASVGRSMDELARAMPDDRLDKVAAALLIVPPVRADALAEALFSRFGARPELLAASTRFAPLLPTTRALEWSARLRAIGMAEACPLLAQARLAALETPARVRAALSAQAAFNDPAGGALAVALAPGVHESQLAQVLAEVAALSPAVLEDFAAAAAGAGAPGAGPVGTPESRKTAVEGALKALQRAQLAAQIANESAGTHAACEREPQLAASGADR